MWKREMYCRSGSQFDVGEGIDSNELEESDFGDWACFDRNALRAF